MTTKTEGGHKKSVQINRIHIKRVTNFVNLVPVIETSDTLDKEISNRMESGWNKWRKIAGVTYDRKVPVKLKGKMHKTEIRPWKMYGLGTPPIKNRLDAAEMKMLR